MGKFPEFINDKANAIAAANRSKGVTGFVFDGVDRSQVCFFECQADGISKEHTHDYDEWFCVVEGRYTLIIGDKKMPVGPGQEQFIPKGVPHSGEFTAGTRTINAFGGKRAEREHNINGTLIAISRRRSTRSYRPDQISDAELTAVIEAARQAPSGHNDQSCFFSIVQNRALIDEMSEGSKAEMCKIPVDWMAAIGKNKNVHIYHHAPTVIIVSSRKNAVSPLPDACAAIENMLIAAESMGLGSCWIGFTKFYFNGPESYRKLEIPEGYEVHYGVALGYKPQGIAQKPPERKSEPYRIIK
ncbi:MAG TPA: nitroreductase family protein [Candidatus Omnitrophota bacterium]|nr:nitroreductase family protein [Candidatus Omnitrophota bacterium]